MEAATASNMSEPCGSSQQMPPSERVCQTCFDEQMIAPLKQSSDATTDHMLKDAALQTIIRSNLHVVVREYFSDAFKRITDIEQCLQKRMRRLENLIGDPPSDGMPKHLSSCEGQQQMEVLNQMERPCGCCTCRKLPTCIPNQPMVSQDSSPSAQHIDLGSLSPREAPSSDPHTSQVLQTSRDAPPPCHDIPCRTSVPRSSSYSTRRRAPHRSASAQPTWPAQRRHSDHSPFHSPVTRPVRRPTRSMTMEGLVDWQSSRIFEEAGLTRKTSYEEMHQAQRQQQHQGRRSSQGDTGGHISVMPESPTTPGCQGRRSSLYASENDHGMASSSESSTTKEKATGRLQRLMGKHWWLPSHKAN